MLDEHYFATSVGGIFPGHNCEWSNNYMSDFSTDLSPSQLTSDLSDPTWAPHGNALGLADMDMFELDSAWSTPSSQTITPNTMINAPIYSTSVLGQPPTPNGETNFWPSFAPQHAFIGKASTIASRGIQGQHFVHHPTVDDAPLNTFAPRVASRTHYTPYALAGKPARRDDASTSFHRCQWSDGATSAPCGAVIESTKNAIGQHLQTAHAIRLSANKNAQDEVCLWGRCLKSMRKESIARHVLAVHLKDRDRVRCSWCGSKFARPDSMQRHQRSCSSKGETEDGKKDQNLRLR